MMSNIRQERNGGAPGSGHDRLRVLGRAVLLVMVALSGHAFAASLAPQPGDVVETHSLKVSLELDAGLDAKRLQMTLNGQDLSAHLRISGSEAEGFASGMTPGLNVLQFSVPDSQGKIKQATVQFEFAPVPITAIELLDEI